MFWLSAASISFRKGSAKIKEFFEMANPIKSEYFIFNESVLEPMLPQGVKTVSYDQLNAFAHKILPEQARKVYRMMSQKITVKNASGEVVPDPFAFGRVAIKNNVTNWGSCSDKRNLNLNMHLVRLPQALMNYVIAHELCHLVYFDHSPRFHAIMNAVTNGKERTLERALKKVTPDM